MGVILGALCLPKLKPLSVSLFSDCMSHLAIFSALKPKVWTKECVREEFSLSLLVFSEKERKKYREKGRERD